MQSLKISNFYVRSGLFGVLSLVGALFNYALYPVLVRVLDTKAFGDFAVIMALYNQLLGILLAFNVISIYLVKSQTEEKARNHAQIIQKNLVWLLVGATALLLVFSPYLNELFKVYNSSYFLVLALILLASIPGVIWTGFLQGHKELVRVGGFNISASLGKLVVAIILSFALGTIGGLIGVLSGTIIGLLVLWVIPGVRLPNLSSLFKQSDPQEKQFLLTLKGYILECIVVIGTLGFLQNYDITLAKALFSPATAGIYSGVSILSNALYFLCFLLIWIVLPEIEIGNRVVNRRVLSTAYKLLAALTVCVILVELLLKNSLTGLLLGPDYANLGNILVFASLYQLTLVSVTLYAFYLLVNRKRRAGLLAALVVGSTLVVPAVLADSPLMMIKLLWVSLLLGIGAYWILVKTYRVLRAERPD